MGIANETRITCVILSTCQIRVVDLSETRFDCGNDTINCDLSCNSSKILIVKIELRLIKYNDIVEECWWNADNVLSLYFPLLFVWKKISNEYSTSQKAIATWADLILDIIISILSTVLFYNRIGSRTGTGLITDWTKMVWSVTKVFTQLVHPLPVKDPDQFCFTGAVIRFS